MKCPKCGQEATGRYCSKCGASLAQDRQHPIIDIEDYMDDGEEMQDPDVGSPESDSDATRVFQPENVRSRTMKTDTAVWASPSQRTESSSEEEALAIAWEETAESVEEAAVDEEEISGADTESVESPVQPAEQKPSFMDKLKKALTEVEDDEWADDYEEDEDEEEDTSYVKSKNSGSSDGGSRGKSSSHRRKKKKSRKGKSKSKKRGRKGTARRSLISQIGNIICTILRFLCFFVMLWIWWRLMNAFWTGKDAFGSLETMVPTGNITMLLYVCVGTALVAVAFISSFWTLTRKKVRGSGMSMRCDIGRGLSSFVLFLALSFCAGLATLLPDSPAALYGFKQAILVLNSTSILYASAFGTVLCFIRRILKM